MSGRSRVAVALLVTFALTATVGAGSRLERLESQRERTSRDLLYLPNGKLLKVASLGLAPLVADAFYIWAIQYYSDYERGDRYRWVEHVFDQVITELDPHYIDAYWLGSMILILEAGEPEAGLRLLEKGAAHNPDEWVLLYLAGWESYHAGQRDRAQEYFRRAMRVKGAPAVLPRLVAGIEARKGNVREALRMWHEVLDDPTSDDRARAVAERQVLDLTLKAEMAALNEAVARFRAAEGRLPSGLGELVARGYLRGIPLDQHGRPYVFDPVTGAVRAPERRVLAGS